jgi:hypothetical protein
MLESSPEAQCEQLTLSDYKEEMGVRGILQIVCIFNSRESSRMIAREAANHWQHKQVLHAHANQGAELKM